MTCDLPMTRLDICLSPPTQMNKTSSKCEWPKFNQVSLLLPRSLNFDPLLILSKYRELNQMLDPICLYSVQLFYHAIHSSHSPTRCSFHVYLLCLFCLNFEMLTALNMETFDSNSSSAYFSHFLE